MPVLASTCTVAAIDSVLSSAKSKVDRHRFQRQVVAQRDQFGRALGRHDAGQPGDFQHVAFGRPLVAHECERFRRSSE